MLPAFHTYPHKPPTILMEKGLYCPECTTFGGYALATISRS